MYVRVCEQCYIKFLLMQLVNVHEYKVHYITVIALAYMCVFVGLGKGSLEILKCMFLVPPTGTLLLPVTNSSSCCCCSRLKLFTISQKFLKKQSKQYHVPPVIIILYHIWRFHNNCEAILCNYRPLAAPLRTT